MTARAPEAPATASYVFGIVRAGARVPDDLVGLDGGEVGLVPCEEVAAVVGGVLPEGPLGTREDLLAHEDVVAAIARHETVLPFRFGAVVTTADAVAEELLEPHHRWFADALAELRGKREFVVTGSYEQDAVLREIARERPEVVELSRAIGGRSVEESYGERIQLGETISHALDDKRREDTEKLIDALREHASDVVPREPSGEDAATDVAFLVDKSDRRAFEDAVDELGGRWAGRITLRLLGPLAAYDFAPIPEEV